MSLKKIKNILHEMQGYEGSKIVILATTANENHNDFHIGPVKSFSNDVAINIVFKDLKNLNKIINFLDGKIDLFAIDTEVKSKINNLKSETKKFIKKSKSFYFKPNDYTLTSSEMFIGHLSNNQKISRALVCGLGNIGTKLALKLLEMGIKVEFVKKSNNEKSNKIAEVINMISSSQVKIDLNENKKYLEALDLIIFCNSNKYEIQEYLTPRITSNTIIIDIGQGVIGSKSLKLFKNLGCPIYSLNSEPGFWGSYVTYKEYLYLLKGFGRKKINQNLAIISIGMFGHKGDILVDNINNITKCYGICDGNGGLMKDNSKLLSLRKINMIINRGN